MTRRRAMLTSITVLVIGLGIWWLLHPVCRPLSEADVREFAQWAPIETRQDQQLHRRVFQQHGGRWYQCKSWASRQFFF
jgi:ABC-type nickel/cobalt efflux system permease component RcnA